MHIGEHGYPVLFRSREYICFDVGAFKYWTMSNSLETTTIINRAQNSEITAMNETTSERAAERG
jgi:hypothetical protein